jgi:nucleotide-binding universal stress UspA family protein
MVVVVAISGSEQTELVVEGATLADALDEALHVVHVMDVDMEERQVTTSGDEAQKRLEEIARERASGATSGLSRESKPVGLVGENVPKEVVSYAREQDTSYIVIGGRKRSPTGKAIFGDTTQSILLRADRPVLAVMQD